MPAAGARHRKDLALKILALALSQSLLRQILLGTHEGLRLRRNCLSYLNSARPVALALCWDSGRCVRPCLLPVDAKIVALTAGNKSVTIALDDRDPGLH